MYQMLQRLWMCLLVALGLAGEDCIWPRDVSDGNLGRDLLEPEEDLKMPAFLRVITSSAVYSSKSPATPQKSMSLPLKRPMVTKRSLISCYRVTVWCTVVMQDDYLWKKILRELHASRNEKVFAAGSHCILTLRAICSE